MAKHTPGPWKIGPHSEWSWDDTLPIVFGDSIVLACAWPLDAESAEDSPECQANARLIAAAPKLLEACEEMLRTFTCPSRQLLNSTRRELDPWLPMLREAIAQATSTGATHHDCGQPVTKAKGRWQCPVHGECHHDEIDKEAR